MLVCNISQRPPRRTIAVDLEEAGAADDASTTGFVIFATLVDDPASVGEIVDAYLGEIMLEAASASDTPDASIAAIITATIIESASAADVPDYVSLIPGIWNPADKGASCTLSGGNLTATATSATGGGVRGTPGNSSGKFYFEYTMTNLTSGSCGAGLAPSSASLVNSAANSSGITAIAQSGAVFVNAVSVVSGAGAIPAGAVVQIAVDLGAQLIWYRVPANSSQWNYSGTADPATGTGGFSISALSLPLYPFTAMFAATSSVITANFGASSFSGTAPTGFAAGWG